jgi:hypothetical protein
MQLGCINFIELRVYESTSEGRLGRILSSSCLPAARLGDPPDLCALQQSPTAVQLLAAAPTGKPIRLRLRTLVTPNPDSGCNDDLPGGETPIVVFDGFSAAVTLDDASHVVPILLGWCGSCADLPKACGQGGPCGPDGPSCVHVGHVGAARCCPPPDASCLSPGATCPNGGAALLPPGGCCALCAT